MNDRPFDETPLAYTFVSFVMGALLVVVAFRRPIWAALRARLSTVFDTSFLYPIPRHELDYWEHLGDTPEPEPDGGYACEKCFVTLSLGFDERATKLCSSCAQDFIATEVPRLTQCCRELQEERTKR